jgi:hypothetical protein
VLTLFGKFLVQLSKLYYSPRMRALLRKGSRMLGAKYADADSYRTMISGKKVIVLGSGLVDEQMRAYVRNAKENGALLLGTAWSAQIFNDIDLLLCAHAAHLISGIHSHSPPKKMAIALPYPMLSVFEGVEQVRRLHVDKLTRDEIIGVIDTYKDNKDKQQAVVLSLSNAMFLGIYFALMHEASEIELLGFDPMNPDYGFSATSIENLLEKLTPKNGVCVDSYLGSNYQTPREALERIHATLKSGATRCVENLEPLREKMHFTRNILDHFNVPLTAIGKSDFMDSIAGMKRVRLD